MTAKSSAPQNRHSHISALGSLCHSPLCSVHRVCIPLNQQQKLGNRFEFHFPQHQQQCSFVFFCSPYSACCCWWCCCSCCCCRLKCWLRFMGCAECRVQSVQCRVPRSSRCRWLPAALAQNCRRVQRQHDTRQHSTTQQRTTLRNTTHCIAEQSSAEQSSAQHGKKPHKVFSS